MPRRVFTTSVACTVPMMPATEPSTPLSAQVPGGAAADAPCRHS